MRPFILVFSFLILFSTGRNLSPDAEELSSSDRATGPDPEAIGCLLPMSGEYEAVGRKVLRGITIATDVFRLGTGFKIIIRDSSGEVENVIKALDEMVRADRVSFVVGPVPDSHIGEIARTIESLGIPTLIFPVSEDGDANSSFLVKFSYSAERQAEALAKYAVDTMGIKTFGILYPRNHIGKVFHDAFAESLKRAGGRVTYAGSYDSALRQIPREMGWIKSINPRAIFIPDSATRSGELLKKLKRQLTLGDVLFLGPSTWNSKAFLRSVGNEIDGVIFRVLFTDSFYPQDSKWVNFSDKYEEAYAEEPGFLEFQVYEAVNLLLGTLQNPIRSRGEILERLLSGGSSRRFDISASMNGAVEILLKPIMLTIKDGEIIRIE